jgi:hypothetical protein
MTDEHEPDGSTDEELEDQDDGPLDQPPTGPHGEPGIPRFEPLPGPIELPPVPGQSREKPLD